MDSGLDFADLMTEFGVEDDEASVTSDKDATETAAAAEPSPSKSSRAKTKTRTRTGSIDNKSEPLASAKAEAAAKEAGKLGTSEDRAKGAVGRDTYDVLGACRPPTTPPVGRHSILPQSPPF